MKNAKKQLKIGFVLDDTLDSTDGVQQYVLTVGKWLGQQGHQVYYLVGETKRQDLKNIHSMAKNVQVRFNKNRLTVPLPVSSRLIKQKLNELKLDILHIQMPYSPFFAGRVIKAAPPKTKIIGTMHIIPANWLHLIGAHGLALLSRRTVKQFDQVISVSPAAASFARSVFGVESTVIPNAINLKTFKHPLIVNKKPTIIFLGRLVERKGAKYLLKSLVRLQQQYKRKYQVIIGGRGPLKSKLESFVTKNKLKNIKFIGFVEEEDKSALLASADIAVFPSTGGESFGISLLESMAAGARVTLGGDNAGYRGVLADYPDLLINPRDSVSFANRLQYFLEHKDAARAAAKWAKESVKQYDIGIVGKHIVAVYRQGDKLG